MRDRRGARRPAAGLPVPGQRPGGGDAGQAPGARHARRPPHPADGPGRDLRRHRAARAAARRARERRGARPGQAAGDPPADLDADAGREAGPRPRSGGAPARGGVRRLHPARRRLALRDQGRPDPRRPAHPRRAPRPATRGWTWCSRSCAPARCGAASRACRACARPWACPTTRPRPGSTRSRRWRTPSSRAWRPPAGSPTRRPPSSPTSANRRTRAGKRADSRENPRESARSSARVARCRRCDVGQVERVLRFAAEEVVPRLDATVRGDPAGPARPRRRLHPRRPVRLAAARAGQRAPDRPELLLRRPQGRPVAAGVGDRAGDGRVAGRALPPRPRRRVPEKRRPERVGHVRDAHLRRRHRRGLRAARGPPGLGRGVPPRRDASR